MSVSVPVKPICNQTYGSISANDSTQSSLHSSNVSSPWCTNLNVCSSKKESFSSTWCSPFKLCITTFSLLSLIILSLFVSGVMFVNLKDGIGISTGGGFNKKLISKTPNKNSYIQSPNTLNKINKQITLSECEDMENYLYPYTFTYTYLFGTDYEEEYFCYTNQTNCQKCYTLFEDNDMCPEDDDDDNVGCFSDCDKINDEDFIVDYYPDLSLYCFLAREEDECFSWDSIVTKVIGINNNNNNLITQDVMINDIKLGDYVITGIKGEYSKVIDMSHYTVYEKSTEKTQMIEICFDTDSIHGDEEGSVLYNCIKMTGKHLIYVNGIDLDSLNTAESIKIGDYLYHSGLKQFVVVTKINRGINDYFRNIITEDGNIIINNGFFASTIAQSKSSNNGNVKEIHVNMVHMYNVFYKIFTLNGNYEDLWESEWFDHILRIPTKNAISQWIGYGSQFSQKYPYPVKSMICAQCIGCFLVYLFTKGMINLFSQSTKSVSY